MAIAGKVAITPKGEWNANTTYEKLDLVFYENASYVATKPSTGVSPTDESSWMLVVQSAGGADLEAIISGAQQVGNAKTLDGHEAEYFLPKKNGVIPKGTSLLFEKTDNSTLAGNVKIEVSGDYIRFSVNGGNSKGAVIKLSECLDWLGSVLLHTGNMASYVLPLTGVNTTIGRVQFKHADNGYCYVNKNHNSSVDYGMQIGDVDKDGNLTYLEFSAKGNDLYLNTRGITNTLLHTGNKPTGTYTGNGDATERTINIGSAIPRGLIITSEKGMVITTYYGSICKGRASAEVVGLSWGDGGLTDSGVLRLVTTSEFLNASGVVYTYYSI